MAKSLLVHLFLLTLHIELHHAYLYDNLGLSINLKKNQTGHMVTNWTLINGSPKIPENMKIDINTRITENGGIQFLHLHGLIVVPPPKPAGYELFPGVGYYKFHPETPSTYDEASSICTKEGGHLAIVNSEAEKDVLMTLYNRYPQAKRAAWLGFHDIDVEGKFVTIFGDSLEKTGFSSWCPYQPDNWWGIEDCGSIKRSGCLNDISCDSTNEGPWPFFCEYDLTWM